MGLDIKMDGFDDLIAEFGKMQEVSKDALLEEAVDAGSKVMIAAVKNAAPRSAIHRGASEKSQTWRDNTHMKESIGRNKIVGGPSYKCTRIAPDDAKGGAKGKHFYWRFLEYGSSKMKARPFMTPAFDATEAKTASVMENTLIKGLGI